MERNELGFWLIIITLLTISIGVAYWITLLCIDYPETAIKVVLTSLLGACIFVVISRHIDRTI